MFTDKTVYKLFQKVMFTSCHYSHRGLSASYLCDIF